MLNDSAFVLMPTSIYSNFSLSDSVSDIITLDMSDDYDRSAASDEVFMLEKEGSLNSLMITIIVSLRHIFVVHCLTGILFYRSTTSTFALILTSSKENWRLWGPSLPSPSPTQSICKTLPQPSLEPCGGSSMKGSKSSHAALVHTSLILALLQGCMTTTSPPLPSGWLCSPWLTPMAWWGCTVAPLLRLKILMSPMIPSIECSWPSGSTLRSGLPLPMLCYAPVQTLSKHLKPRSSVYTLL